ncbi:PTS sugar transporter subunit IIA [Vallitalea okinawensis]|uniref:PTS sugar transporter subunit IIA n=1 Tax=Vallitalea okinawensis TaxID=2078660 RepID=UPI000CFDEBB4|nr:PTS glucose transporter subunit IIA [Vallitalea okinawensis]
MLGRQKIKVYAPIEGHVMSIEKVPDEVFSKRMVGDGIAINPNKGVVYAPVSGKVVTIFPTYHAIGIETKEGLEVLVHIGLDTVELGGLGFNSYVEDGDNVSRGDKIIEFDLHIINANEKSPICPVIITNLNAFTKLKVKKRKGLVTPNDTILEIIK